MSRTTSRFDKRASDTKGGVTARAVVIALVLLALVALLNFFVEIKWGTDWSGSWAFSSGVPAIVPVVVIVLLTLGVSLPGLRRMALTRREILSIYAVVLVGAPVLTHGVLVWVLVKNIALYYSAQVNHHWRVMFLDRVPTWYAPTGATAVQGFFEGHAAVPWAEWSTPLLAWSGFVVALFVANLCLVALLQRQWITHERLTFPLAQIPLETIRPAGSNSGRARPGLPVSWVFWIGAIIAFTVNFLSALSGKVPAMPDVPLGPVEIIPWQRVGPMAGLGAITLVLWPWMIALAYLIPKELSFSVWFFTVVRHLLTVGAIAAGATPMRPEDWWSTSFPAPYYQGGGAVVALAVWAVWIARKHLKRAAQVALSRGRDAAEAEEPLGYRWAFLGFLLSCAFLVYFLWRADCRLAFGLMVVALTIGYFAIWARLRAETGLGFLCFPIQIQDVVMVPFGSASFRVSELVNLVSLRSIYTPGFGTSFEIFPQGVLESYKIADVGRISKRRLTVAMTLGFVVSLVAGIVVFMIGVYYYGWFGLSVSSGGWLGPQSLNDGGRIVSFLNDPNVQDPDLNGILALLSGAGVVVVLGMLRLRFWWWPLHPVGYIAANTWGSHWWYMPFFIGWVCKVLVSRYGGLRLFRTTVPFAIGLIVGDLLNGGLWTALTIITRGEI